MIQNERQYRVTRAQAERFERALQDFRAGTGVATDPLIARAQEEALAGQLEDLLNEIREYEQLKAEEVSEYELESLEQVPDVLIRARISAGLTQRELGERLGLPEQQIQRYEATGYSSASFARLVNVADALGLRFKERLRLPKPPRVDTIVRGLRSIGFDPGFVQRRLLPSTLASVEPDSSEGSGMAASRLAAVVARMLDGNAASILAGELFMPPPQLTGARFKLPARVRDEAVRAYAAYAHYLAMILLDISEELPTRPVPVDAEEVNHALQERGGASFESALEYVWSIGIPVLPLKDPGAFHAAMWRRNGRSVIVLKQSTRASARWAFDLLHELRHAGEVADREEGVVETKESVELAAKDDDREIEANEFAGAALLGSKVDGLARAAAARAGRRVELLKAVVPAVAREGAVPVDAFANFLAYRLSLQGINWWGTATALQTRDDPWGVARDLLLQRVDVSRLDPIDRDLIGAALSEE
jgi:Helix-turn-helix